jgi:hypothetical protein
MVPEPAVQQRPYCNTPSPFAGVTFLKTTGNGKTAKLRLRGTKDTRNMTLNMYNLREINMKTLVSVFIGMTSAILAENCQGDRTQGQQSVLKIAKSTVEVHSVWHHYLCSYWDRRQIRAVSVLLRAPAQERGTYAAMHKYYHDFSSYQQTRERGGSAVFVLFILFSVRTWTK